MSKKLICIKWHIDDVLSVRPDLTPSQTWKVLERIRRNHDANVGVNWDVIEIVSDILFPEPTSENS